MLFTTVVWLFVVNLLSVANLLSAANLLLKTSNTECSLDLLLEHAVCFLNNDFVCLLALAC